MITDTETFKDNPMKNRFALLVILSLVISAFSVVPEIENADAKKHHFTIKDSYTSTVKFLKANGKMSINASGALLTVTETGDTMTIHNNRKYVIKDGILTKYRITE